MPATTTAERQNAQAQCSLADRMALNITESLDARRHGDQEQGVAQISAKLADNVVIAAGRTWRTIRTSTKKPSRFLGQHLGWLWNKLVAMLGAPPPADKPRS